MIFLNKRKSMFCCSSKNALLTLLIISVFLTSSSVAVYRGVRRYRQLRGNQPSLVYRSHSRRYEGLRSSPANVLKKRTLVGPNVCGGKCCEGWYAGNSAMCITPVCRPSCRNGGRCIRPDVCFCPSSHTGKHCDKKVTTKTMMENNRKRDPRQTVVHVRYEPYSSTRSQDARVACSPMTCFNGGTCVRGKCICREGYMGHRCEKVVVVRTSVASSLPGVDVQGTSSAEVARKLCKALCVHGTCRGRSGQICRCHPGYHGTMCDSSYSSAGNELPGSNAVSGLKYGNNFLRPVVSYSNQQTRRIPTVKYVSVNRLPSRHKVGKCFKTYNGASCGLSFNAMMTMETCCSRGLGDAWRLDGECTPCPNGASGSHVYTSPSRLEQTHSTRNNCPAGFKLLRGRCHDVNECLTRNGRICEHGKCNNIRGSYWCQCISGYYQHISKKHCLPNFSGVRNIVRGAVDRCYLSLDQNGQCAKSVAVATGDKAVCCCSVGAAWGAGCEMCPERGSHAYRRLCPKGSGYHKATNSVAKPSSQYRYVLPRTSPAFVRPTTTTTTTKSTTAKSTTRMAPTTREKASPITPKSVEETFSRKSGSDGEDVQSRVATAVASTRATQTDEPSRKPIDNTVVGGEASDEKTQVASSQGNRNYERTTTPTVVTTNALEKTIAYTTASARDTKSHPTTTPPTTAIVTSPETTKAIEISSPASTHKIPPHAAITTTASRLVTTKSSVVIPPVIVTTAETAEKETTTAREDEDGDESYYGGDLVTDEFDDSLMEQYEIKFDNIEEEAYSDMETGVAKDADETGTVRPQSTTVETVDAKKPELQKTDHANATIIRTDEDTKEIVEPALVPIDSTKIPSEPSATNTPFDDSLPEFAGSRQDTEEPSEAVDSEGAKSPTTPTAVVSACSSNPCLHGGECVPDDDPSSFSCRCGEGYFGILCETKDYCVPDPCFNDASCEAGIDFYYCACPEGFTGKNCEAEISACEPNPCLYGTCMESSDTYKCLCEDGYQGEKCSEDIDECSDECDGGTCMNTEGSFYCDCFDGYEVGLGGTTCEEIDMCLFADCGDTATCRSVPGSYLCECMNEFEEYDEETQQCVSQYAGPDERKPCYPRPHSCANVLATNLTKEECCCTIGQSWGDCNSKQICPMMRPDFERLCSAGRGLAPRPKFGTVDLNECELFGSEKVCGSGRCINSYGRYECVCFSGFYYNVRIQACDDINECRMRNKCVGGRCLNLRGSYKCQCPARSVLRYNGFASTCTKPSSGFPYRPALMKKEKEETTESPVFKDTCYRRMTSKYQCIGGFTVKFSYEICCCAIGVAWGASCSACPERGTDDYRFLCQRKTKPVKLEEEGDLEAFHAQECGPAGECENGRCLRSKKGMTCECNEGYRLDADLNTCTDINECEENEEKSGACTNGVCVNIPGSFECQCHRGFQASQDDPTVCVLKATNEFQDFENFGMNASRHS